MSMNPMVENSVLYSMVEVQRMGMTPMRAMAKAGRDYFNSPMSPFYYNGVGRYLSAGCELVERVTRRYGKPEFGITNAKVGKKQYKVIEEVVYKKPFCNLIKFSHQPNIKLPKLLIVAPMSGHHATLLRGTVKAMLSHCDVYITDWIDAREIPVNDGHFGFDEYVYYVNDFMNYLGEDHHVMAVCQPSVPVLAAIALASDPSSSRKSNQPKLTAPKGMILMGGPIDTRENPTEVNRLAEQKPLDWFERHVVTRVPINHPGFMRRVYPGFLQLTGFMQLNLERHIGEHVKLFNHLVDGDGESSLAHKKFYNEYLSVMDLPAEFYLDTIKKVFQDYDLPKGNLTVGGKKIKAQNIKNAALLTIEGERDDISGVGQTYAAHKICSGLPASKKFHHMQEKVGHYGIFNGRRFREYIVPVIADFINKTG